MLWLIENSPAVLAIVIATAAALILLSVMGRVTDAERRLDKMAHDLDVPEGEDDGGRDGGQFMSSIVPPPSGGDGGTLAHPSFRPSADYGPGHSPRRIPRITGCGR